MTGDGDTDDAVVELEAFDDVDEKDFDELLDVDLEDEVEELEMDRLALTDDEKEYVDEQWDLLTPEQQQSMTRINFQNATMKELYKSETPEVKQAVIDYIARWDAQPKDRMPAGIPEGLHDRVKTAVYQFK